MIIGLTGLTGAGKSTAADFLRRRGCHVIDADKVSRRVTDRPDILEKIKTTFGAECINADGGLNRRVLGQIVFNDAEKLRLLNAITHPPITAEILAETKSHEGETVILDVPLLKESGLDKVCDFVLRITAPEDVRAGRIMARDGLSLEEARARISSQAPFGGPCIDIDNSASEEELETRLTEVLCGQGLKI
ncbi:MAG: dephospho-CoA kinase [Oscillospiraceae bacterium]|nr:dephospho-CoA kinase [Oscillospiraceae bacterium]